MKALPMTMEDKCAFVDLISQNSGNGDNQEDEWFYFDVRTMGVTDADIFLLALSPYIIVDMDDKILEINTSMLIDVATSTKKTPIAIKTRKWVCVINDVGGLTEVKLEYKKADAVKYMTLLGAKQITKEEYYSFINFTEDDFEETPLG